MESKLLIGILGNYGSGKSTTWRCLFDSNVHTGKKVRMLKINDIDIPVFLINESPLERKTKLTNILPNKNPEIVLSSFLYHKDVKSNFDYYHKNGYQIYVHWLNPGYNDSNTKALFYSDGIINYLLGLGATVAVKSGKDLPEMRVQELRNYLYSYYISKNIHLINVDKTSKNALCF